MAIFANQSAIRFSSTPVDIVARRPISDGSLLIYDKTLGAFVTATGRNNKELVAGAGITFNETSTQIQINASTNPAEVSVPGDYTIVIDNDNNENAVFQLYHAVSGGGSAITISPQISSLSVSPVTGAETSGTLTYNTTGGADFSSVFQPGNFITVSGTDEQDEDYLCLDIFDNGKSIELDPLDGTLDTEDIDATHSSVDFTAFDLYAPDTVTIRASLTDFGPLGEDLKQGMEITISGSQNGDFDGTYELAADATSLGSGPMAWSELSLNTATPLPTTGVIKDDPLSPTLTITVGYFIQSTGFFVEEDGSIHGTSLDLGSGSITAGSGVFSANLVADGLIVDDNASVGGDFTVSGNALLYNDLTVDGTLTASNFNFTTLTLDDLTVTDGLELTNGDLVVTGNIIVQEDPARTEDTGNIEAQEGLFKRAFSSIIDPTVDSELTTRLWIERSTVMIDNITGAAYLPTGTTGQRPTNPEQGMIRFNTDSDTVEVYTGTTWRSLQLGS